ncbi:hypothetical protein [Tahibacter amnicola]|uniref:Uncharacterized protein n=1 Tax=Tahibacter amnicola TaxID=2976241 RepID=A0ABY6BFF3_9GAMM|nr:hypothetical protein [Tahibacter amnicola]UXI68550.1 hypothetical protein N4264_02535 [Tahibacter amnicola]
MNAKPLLIVAALMAQVLLWLPGHATACSIGPQNLTWSEMLEKATGAVTVRPVISHVAGDRVVVELKRESVIHDPRALFRGQMVVAVPYAETIDRHRQPAFWAGKRPAGSRTPSCRFEQVVDASKSYVLLLSVQGEYTLEPIFGDDDPWLEAVKAHFRTGKPDVRLHVSFKLVRSGRCVMNHAHSSGLQVFKECLLTQASRIPTRPLPLDVDVDGATLHFDMKIHEAGITPAELQRVFGTDFGLTDGIPFESMVRTVTGP